MERAALSAPELLQAHHDVSGSSCGKPPLDHWLKARALANQKRGFSVVMVVHAPGRVVGYYGLAPTAVVPAFLPRATGQPPNPVPCILLGQLATDREWAGMGIGSGLFNHALARAVSGAALIVNAVDAEAGVRV